MRGLGAPFIQSGPDSAEIGEQRTGPVIQQMRGCLVDVKRALIENEMSPIQEFGQRLRLAEQLEGLGDIEVISITEIE